MCAMLLSPVQLPAAHRTAAAGLRLRRQQRWNPIAAAVSTGRSGNPWERYGGSPSQLEAVELRLGLWESRQHAEQGVCVWTERREAAVAAGRAMEAYVSSSLASEERYLLWELFRADVENVLREVSDDKNACVLTMGGAAQGMATVDGDLDLILFVPSRVADYASLTGRHQCNALLRRMKLALRGKHKIDFSLVDARVPILQHQAAEPVGALFSVPGADLLVRCLALRDPQETEGAAAAAASDLEAAFGVPVEVVTMGPGAGGTVFVMPCSAYAYSALFRFPRRFALLHLPGKTEQSLVPPSGVSAPVLTSAAPDGGTSAWAALRAAAPGAPAAASESRPIPFSPGPEGHIPYPFAVDLSVAVSSAPWGPRNSELLRRYLSTDPAVKVLAVTVKWWSKRSRPVEINAARMGWLTSYATLVMLIHWLVRSGRVEWIDPQKVDPVLEPDVRFPASRKLTDDECVQVVRDFTAFCEYFATGFDYNTEVVTLSSPQGRKLRSECTPEVLSGKPGGGYSAFIIEDPYENRTLGHSVGPARVVLLRAAFLAGARGVWNSVAGPASASDLLERLRQYNGELLQGEFRVHAPRAAPPAAGDGSCAVCGGLLDEEDEDEDQQAADAPPDVCSLCIDAAEGARIPLEFCARRAEQPGTPVAPPRDITERRVRKGGKAQRRKPPRTRPPPERAAD